LLGLTLALAAASLACGGDAERPSPSPSATSAAAGRLTPGPALTPEATIDLNRTPVAAPTAPAGLAPGQSGQDRLIIGKIGVSAPLSYKRVGLDGFMPDPDGPDDVAFYDFAAIGGLGGLPGIGGNVVMSGHVDYGRGACKNGTVPPPCEAVFYDLSDLRLGDVIEVHYRGQVYRYGVTASQQVDADANWGAIVSATSRETLTLITCEGTFNSVTREYSDRRVVTAERI
jgi:LPXTG-site transpeptidase (sortase) family protein